jgi:hypothetical protein
MAEYLLNSTLIERRFPIRYELYHSSFRKKREINLAWGNHQCLRCGVCNRSIAYNSDGEIYVIFLHNAHVFPDQKDLEDAPTILLCPRCHWFYDKPRSRQTPEGREDWRFIGYVAQLFIEISAREAICP